MIARRFKAPLFIAALIASFLAIFVLAMLSPVLFPVDLGATDLLNRLIPPIFLKGGQAKYVLGTDFLGRDFLIRLFYATRNSLLIAIAGLLISSAIGTLLGVLAGLLRGWVDLVISFVMDVLMSIPSIIIAIVLASAMEADSVTIALIVGFTGFASFTRLVRGQTIQLKEMSFIESSRALGASTTRILFEHVLVNISSPLIVHASMKLGSFILLESSLSFLGLGIQPPDTSLGAMVSDGRDHLINNWWLAIVPSLIIVIIVLQVSLVGDWLRDRLDPKLKS
ncbi:ABC transporter permease [Cohnella sp. JJ-181]|uniref:ABC transporter permease n=1 Tax=Cohnella rhizoplanae TaxID=2974897 RepID=UPI0022FF7E2B|nr:ABC transporter permease [Cohnella sp. JJ-181]CAI6085715.1 putative D,D-dipeptide transport system permease protein DdpC [Cohnella sp. JJ-181]